MDKMVEYGNLLGLHLKALMESVCRQQTNTQRLSQLEEIRLRIGKPLLLKTANGEFFVQEDGSLCEDEKQGYPVTERDIKETMMKICKDSVFAYEDELKWGYLNVEGGHRIGITGQVVQNDLGDVKTIKYINGLNIRLAHERKGVATPYLPYLYENGCLQNTLLISPPGVGKTTLLRDLIRQVSDGNACGKGVCVGVVDERSEIAGAYRGIPQNDVGMRTDVMDACPKIHGMMMLLRAMSPRVIAIDEIGGKKDVEAMFQVCSAGSALLATVHGESLHGLTKKPYLQEMINGHIFERFLVLGKEKGRRMGTVYGKDFQKCFEFAESL